MLSLFNTGYGLQDQLDGVKNGIAIVSTGNTHIAITSGQYVYIQDNSTLAEGLYRATANIAANGTLSGSNVTAVSGGGLNALNSKVPDDLSSGSLTPIEGITVTTQWKYKIGKLLTYELNFEASNEILAGTRIFTGLDQNPGTRGSIVTFLATNLTQMQHYTFTAGDTYIYTRSKIVPGTIRCTFSYFISG